MKDISELVKLFLSSKNHLKKLFIFKWSATFPLLDTFKCPLTRFRVRRLLHTMFFIRCIRREKTRRTFSISVRHVVYNVQKTTRMVRQNFVYFFHRKIRKVVAENYRRTGVGAPEELLTGVRLRDNNSLISFLWNRR